MTACDHMPKSGCGSHGVCSALPDAIAEAAIGLVQSTGYGAPTSVKQLTGGGNNRIYRIHAGTEALVLKHYFRHQVDQRDRLGNEYAFLSFCTDRGITCIPRPVGMDAQAGIALYTYVTGEPCAALQDNPPDKALGQEIAEAAAFLAKLHDASHHPEAAALAPASEACLKPTDHFECVDRRLLVLEEALSAPLSESMANACEFVQSVLRPAWNTQRESALAHIQDEEPACRTLSPSDFGFHNALRTAAGLVFLDFEYAGWDDPAKTLCDFVCHPAHHLPFSFQSNALLALAEAVTTDTSEKTVLLERTLHLLPVHVLKWCCIMLNDFKPTDNARRHFAMGGDPEARRAKQLAKVRAYFSASLPRLATLSDSIRSQI